MQTFAIMNLFIMMVVLGIVTLIGLDLAKWHGWLSIAYFFLSGFFIGLSGPKGSIELALVMGAFFTVITSITVKTTYWSGREGFKNWLRESFGHWFQVRSKKDE